MNLKRFVLKNVHVIISITITLEHFDIDNILVDEQSHENILIYDISYKTLIDSKPLRIRFNKIDGFIRIYDRTRYLKLFSSEKYDAIYNRIRFFTKKPKIYKSQNEGYGDKACTNFRDLNEPDYDI